MTRYERRVTGTVSMFDETRGYGAIKPDIDEQVLFLSIDEVLAAGVTDLKEGDRVEFEIDRELWYWPKAVALTRISAGEVS